MYSNQYDGNSLFSGGGFMPSQATQSTDSGFSPAKSRSNQCLLPLTVKQISDAFLSSDDKSNFIIDGVDVNNITLVGMVMNKVEKVTDVNFTLDDGTGRIDIHRWVNDAAESNEMAAIINGMYVRVNGQLKGFQGKKQAVAFSVRPVSDFNEIAYHFIECIHIHQCNTKLQAQGGTAQPQRNLSTSSTVQNGLVGQQAFVSNQFSAHPSIGEAGTDFDQMVLAIFHEPENLALHVPVDMSNVYGVISTRRTASAKESGVHVDKIVERLGVPKTKVMQSINYHTDNGNIYSTIDDYHYKSTING